jgi:hypothetical protein
MSNQNMAVDRKRGWRVYFWLVGLFLVIALVAEIVEPADDPFVDTVDYLTSGFSLAGLFGYAYSRRILSQTIWRIWLPIAVVWDLALLVRQVTKGNLASDLVTFFAIALLWAIVAVPVYVAIYRYGYRSPDLWSVRI